MLTAPVDSLDRFGAMCLGVDVVVAARGIHHGKKYGFRVWRLKDLPRSIK